MIDTAENSSKEQKTLDQIWNDDLRHWVSGSGRFDSACEFHGMVTGLVCNETLPPGNALIEWVQAQIDDLDDAASSAPDRALARFIESTFVSLRETDLTFQPLLPDAASTLAQRVLGLTEWCQGFLYGFAAAPSRATRRLNPETRELLADLSEISRAGLDVEMSAEAAEDSLIEIIEYVRLAVLSLSLDKPVTGPSE